MAATETVVALVSGWVGLKGNSIMVLKDDVFASNDPVVKAYPHFFGPHQLRTITPVIEQATAAPGEKRGK